MPSVVRTRARGYNLRRKKATNPYSVPNVAKPFSVHKNAILRWLKCGLWADGHPRLRLIRGDELIRFLSERQQAHRRKYKLFELICFRSRIAMGFSISPDHALTIDELVSVNSEAR